MAYSYRGPVNSPGGPANTNVTLLPVNFVFSPQNLLAQTARFTALGNVSFAFNPQPLSAVTSRKVILGPAGFSFNPQALGAKTARFATLNPAGFSFNPQALNAVTARKVTLGPVGFLFAPQNLTATYTPGPGGPVNYSVTLSPVSFKFTPQPLVATPTIASSGLVSLGAWPVKPAPETTSEKPTVQAIYRKRDLREHQGLREGIEGLVRSRRGETGATSTDQATPLVAKIEQRLVDLVAPYLVADEIDWDAALKQAATRRSIDRAFAAYEREALAQEQMRRDIIRADAEDDEDLLFLSS